MTGLSAGQHRLEFVDGLEFDPFGDGPDYASEWWDDRDSFKTAERITVTAGSTAPARTPSSRMPTHAWNRSGHPRLSAWRRLVRS